MSSPPMRHPARYASVIEPAVSAPDGSCAVGSFFCAEIELDVNEDTERIGDVLDALADVLVDLHEANAASPQNVSNVDA